MKQIARGSLLLALLAFVSQFTGLLREGVISYFLGATRMADTYIAAYQPIDVLTSALLISLPFGVIPFLWLVQKEYGLGVACGSLRRVQFATVFIVLAGCILLCPFGRWVIPLSDPFLSPTQLTVAIRLWHWMLPAVPLACLTAFFLAQLIYEHRFVCQGLNPMVLNLSIVASGILGWRSLGIFSLALGVLAGFCAQAALQSWTVLRRRPQLLPVTTQRPALVRKALLMIGPVVLLHFLGALNAPIPRRFAAQFGEGSLAAFTYAMRAWLPVFLLGVLSISYPYYSSFAAAVSEDTAQARRLLCSMVRATFLFALPIMAAIALLRHDIVRILFFRGAFSDRAAVAVASTIASLSPFLLGSLLADVLSRCLIALRRPLLACAIYGGMLLLVWIVAGQTARFGVNAIALGWAMCSYAGAAGFLLALHRLLRGHVLVGLSSSLGKIVFAAGLSALAMALVARSLEIFLPTTLLGSVLRTAATLAAGAVTMSVVAWWCVIAEVQVVIRLAGDWSRRTFRTCLSQPAPGTCP